MGDLEEVEDEAEEGRSQAVAEAPDACDHPLSYPCEVHACMHAWMNG